MLDVLVFKYIYGLSLLAIKIEISFQFINSEALSIGFLFAVCLLWWWLKPGSGHPYNTIELFATKKLPTARNCEQSKQH